MCRPQKELRQRTLERPRHCGRLCMNPCAHADMIWADFVGSVGWGGPRTLAAVHPPVEPPGAGRFVPVAPLARSLMPVFCRCKIVCAGGAPRALRASLCLAFALLCSPFRSAFSLCSPVFALRKSHCGPRFRSPPEQSDVTNRTPPEQCDNTRRSAQEQSEIFFRSANAVGWCVTVGWWVGPS